MVQRPISNEIVILSAGGVPDERSWLVGVQAKDLLFVYSAVHGTGSPILRLHPVQQSHTLYIGVTKKLFFRVEQHRNGEYDGFTKRYKIHRLVYFERFQYINNAIAREKQLKGWLRERKVALIEEHNPTWEDIYPLMLRGEWKEKQILRYAQDDNPKN